jgi:methylated-DNA-[protein]-cysteine S-methyltransferase
MTNGDRDAETAADLFGQSRPARPTPAQALDDGRMPRAAADGLPDVAYRTIDSPFGTLLLAAALTGLVRVAYRCQGLDTVLEELASKVSPRVREIPNRLDGAARQLEEYFAGDRRHFDLPLDLCLSNGFRRTVLTYLPEIEYGKTASYGDVAAAVHHSKAARAVGTACATNPLPLVIPCHRVVRTHGLIGSYLGGPEAKQGLVDLEAAT